MLDRLRQRLLLLRRLDFWHCPQVAPENEGNSRSLKLIGHLRRDIDPNMEVDVEILDVNEAEARQLLLSIDPLVGLGQMQEQLYDRLRQTTPTDQPELQAMWAAAAGQSMEALQGLKKPIAQIVPEQYMVLLMCKDEKQQLELLQRFQAEGLQCKALLS